MTTYHPNTGEFPIELRPLPGSERAPAPQARFTAAVDPDSVIEATLLLRRGSATDTAGPAAADPADLATVSGTATALGLKVVFGDLDIEVAGALAPKARQMVYFGPNSDAGFVDAVSDAVHATPTPVAISISWGQNEDDWTDQARRALDGVFADAVALGITVTAAAGDSGSSDGAPDRSHADFPASSPNVLACGGTTLHADASRVSITSETVWNAGGSGGATGGGVSDVFAVPAWQAPAVTPNAPLRGRGVPDVAGNADPSTGYRVLVDGTAAVYGGTSAVAPLWAALIARLAQAAGRSFGLLAAELYRYAAPGQPAAGFRDVTAGDNGAYSAGPGWDACTGLGSPDGVALLQLLRADAPPG